MSIFFEVEDIREYILKSNSWKDFTSQLVGKKGKEKGDAFELLCMCYLKTNSFYGSIFKEVFHQSELDKEIKVEKLKLAKGDIGVDLIGQDFENGYWAIQCKYRSNPKNNLCLNHRLAEFFSMTGGQTLKKELQNRILISTTFEISRNIKENYNDFSQILNDDFSKLTSDDFDKFKDYLNSRYKNIGIKKVPRKLDWQTKARIEVCKRFKNENKGQLIMACGSGKTITSLLIKEDMKAKRILYLLPSLNLINQTLREWVSFSRDYFKPVCVCFDPTSSEIIEKKDRWLFQIEDIVIPVLNSPKKISEQLKGQKEYVIFCTYHSSKLILEAQNEHELEDFEITFCDEAHNCAGNGYKKSGLILDPTKIRTKRKLFMTATPLNLDQKIKEKAFEKNKEVSSMDDPEKFGNIFHTLSFREAVENEILVPYQIIFQDSKQSEAEVIEKILKRELVSIPDLDYIDTESIACDIALIKAMKKYSFRKVITFHRLVEFAEYFSKTFPSVWNWLDKKDKLNIQPECYWISGEKHTQRERQEILDKFRKVNDNQSLIISNSQCLSEGVNVPSLDGICFVDPKRSPNDIMQSVGRVMRTYKGKSVGYIVIPIFINDNNNIDEEINQTRYKYIWEVIKALMIHDEYLSETIKKLRIQLGQRKKPTRDRKGLELPKEIVISEELKNSFADSIEVTLIKELTEDWFEMYGLLKQFLIDNEGNQPKEKDGIKLYNWCVYQRTCYRKKHKWLTDERINLLNELISSGWSWEVLDDNWMDNYLKLRDNLDPKKPFKLSDLPEDSAAWISKIIGNIDNLSDDRKKLILKLESKGLRLTKKSEVNQRDWVRKIKKFLHDNGHLVIPSDDPIANIAQMLRDGYFKRGSIKLKQETKDELNKLTKEGWMWNPSLEISLEKISLSKEWCKTNNSLNPAKDIIIKGNNKTYVNDPRKDESEKRNFKLLSFITQLKKRYRETKFLSDDRYKCDFKDGYIKQVRDITNEEISAIESIKTDKGYWYWEDFDAYLRVYKECFKREIKIIKGIIIRKTILAFSISIFFEYI